MPRLRTAISEAERQTAEDIRKRYGNMLGLKDVEHYLSVSRHTAEKWLSDVDAIIVVRSKKYLAIDIAKKIEKSRVLGGRG